VVRETRGVRLQRGKKFGRAAAVERLTGRCLCRLTTPRACKTLFLKIMGSFGLSGAAGWVGVDIATTVP